MFSAQIFTLYPEVFPGPLEKGLYGKALSKNIWNLKVINIRDYSIDKHKTVDDTPYGGGSGMLIKPDVVAKSLDDNIGLNEKIFYLTPRGKTFDQKIAKSIVRDYILSGGETAAIVVLDSILRLIPGIIGNENSAKEESFENGLLEYPQYTKPKIWEKLSVPEVLLSGDHDKIKDWRLSKSEAITRVRRPDLWQKYKKN